MCRRMTPAPKELQVGGSKPPGGSSSQLVTVRANDSFVTAGPGFNSPRWLLLPSSTPRDDLESAARAPAPGPSPPESPPPEDVPQPQQDPAPRDRTAQEEDPNPHPPGPPA